MTEKALAMPQEIIENKIFLVRGKKVIFDRDRAVLYGVTTGNLNKASTETSSDSPMILCSNLQKRKPIL